MPVVEPNLLEVQKLSKAYPGVQALDSVSFTVARGEVHALLGANGAGKSTLIKILAGAVTKDAGEIRFDGHTVDGSDPHDAVARGIACVYQDPAVVPFLTVEENIFLGQENTNRYGIIRRTEQKRQARALLGSIAPHLDPAQPVGALRTSERQLVALAKALRRDPKLLIMDEPSASMTDPEIQALFGIVRRLREAGTSVLYITHRLEEVFRIADRATVLRDGRHVVTSPLERLSRAQLIDTIAGREVRAEARRTEIRSGRPLLVVKNLRRGGVFAGVSFEVREGEVVALAGLVGAGRTEIARGIFKADAPDGGTIDYPTAGLRVSSPAEAVIAGVAMIPEDRKTQGTVPKMSVADNLMLSSIRRHASRFGVIRTRDVRDTVARNVRQLEIRPPGAENRPIETLSGGNQQKVLLARAMESGASVLILDEPTAGVDVGAKAEIHRLILEIVAQGKGVLLISSEMEEVLALADRILVIREGRLVHELLGHTASSLDVLKSALGEKERRTANG